MTRRVKDIFWVCQIAMQKKQEKSYLKHLKNFLGKVFVNFFNVLLGNVAQKLRLFVKIISDIYWWPTWNDMFIYFKELIC